MGTEETFAEFSHRHYLEEAAKVAQRLRDVADAVERVTNTLQSLGPDEFPEGYYRSQAREELEGTLPQWIFQRRAGSLTKEQGEMLWQIMSPDDRDYWRHEAAAVRRAVARNGFKKES